MTTIGCIPDVHLSDKPPSNCTPAYNDQIFEMLGEIAHLSYQWDAAVFAGDIFHSKIPHRTSHRTVQRMIEIIKMFSCPVFLVPGNHDLANNRLESIYETQPFGTLLHAGAELLNGWASDGLPLYGIPWQQDWNNPGDVFTEWVTEGDARHGSLADCLLVTHAPIYPPGKENPWECIPASEFACAMRHGSCFYGHIHDYHGVYTADGLETVEDYSVLFCNHGALSRGSLHEEDLTRIPAVTVWSVGTSVESPLGYRKFERVELKTAPPASEVFRLTEAAARVDYQTRMEDFLVAVGGSTVARTSVESVLMHLQTLGLPGPELALAEEVLASAAAGELS